MNEEELGSPIYRMNEIHNMLCDMEVAKHAEITQSELATFKLNNRDVLFNRTNSFEWVGRTGLYRKLDNKDFIFASYLVRFTPNQELLLPEYLVAFLNSKYGVLDIKRRARQSINQTNVNPEEVKEIEIPLLSILYQEKIKENFDTAFKHLEKSKQLYTQAEDLLLAEVGLQDFSPSTEAVNIKSFSESFGTSGRLDAEYYQPKYDDIYKKIKINDCVKLDKELERIDTGEYSEVYYNRNEQAGLTFYIRSTNIKYGLIEIDPNYFVPKDKFTRIANKGDIVTARVGSIGVFAEIREEVAGSVYSDNVISFRLPERFIPSVYTLLFNSKPYLELVNRLARGSVQQRLNQETLKDLIIPEIRSKKQQQIAALVEQSFALKAQSEQLLEIAKRAVEIAIEKDEATAMIYIKNETASYE